MCVRSSCTNSTWFGQFDARIVAELGVLPKASCSTVGLLLSVNRVPVVCPREGDGHK